MSHVKLFATITDSSIWDQPDSVCKIWITMLSMADWHGCVYASLPGLANRARKTIAEVEEALAVFRAPDPYSRTPDHDGRRIVDIDGGWMLLNYKKHREARNAEALRDSKREWAATHRASKKVEERRTTSTTSAERRRNHSVSVVSDLSDLVPDPEGVQGEAEVLADAEQAFDGYDADAAAREYVEDMALAEPRRPEDEPQSFPDSEFDAVDVTPRRPVYKSLEGWTPSEELIAYAVAAGLTREYLLERIDDLGLGPIGGTRGVFDRDKYVRKLIPKWRQWFETARANAPAKAKPTGVEGCPSWVRDKHQAIASKHGLDLKGEARKFSKNHHVRPENLQPNDAATAFTKHLEAACRTT